MAFFRKEICPVCGNPVKGIIGIYKIKDNQKLCADCSHKLAMDPSMIPCQTPEDIKKHFKYREENLKLFQNFSTTREIFCGDTYFREDANMKKWYCTVNKNPTNPTLFGYDEIIDYELTENGIQVASGGITSAIAGGAIAGSVGAIVGSNIGKKKSQSTVTSMKMRISLNNPYITQELINFVFVGEEFKVGSFSYNERKGRANNLISLLDSMCAKAAAEKTLAANSAQPSALSSADEILKFKNLLDSGIISQEEFDAKKKQLLGF